MPEREELRTIAHTALEASRADQTEVLVTFESEGLTRFANNAIHQNVHQSNLQVSLRAIIGKQIGVATGNDPSPDALRDLADRAREVARHAAPLEDFVSLPAPDGRIPRCTVAPAAATVACGPEQRAEAVRAMVEIARGEGLSAAGQVMSGQMAVAVVNSLGVEAYYHRGQARGRVVMQGADASGFAETEAEDMGQVEAAALARTAAEKALRSAGPRDLEPGTYTVILEPLAVADMVSMLAIYDLHALAHQEGRSFTSGRMGQQVCGTNISLWDDGCDPRGLRLPCDFEGVPRQRVDLITNGVLQGVTYDSYTAGREPGAVNTGHALPAPNTWGPAPIHVFMNTGEHSLEDMIRATGRGVLVTRFHYTNMIHPVRTVFTGMTRDGTFLIEGGEVTCGVKNLRFTQSILEALSRVDMIGSQGSWHQEAWAPALRIQGFNFSSATQF